MRPYSDEAPPRAIVGFEQDEERHWKAILACGHRQHVRHDPPWQRRDWVTTPDGRASRIGTTLPCMRCLDESRATHPPR